MNNNRNNRRGRGRNNRNQGGNPNAQNRIDNRARGNAPQLLDKYKKLAQDAQHNGDRVQAEYYLQFADHYFRVIADNKARQEEARAKRQEERGDNSDDNDDDDGRNNRRGRGRRSDNDGDNNDRQKPNGRARGPKGKAGDQSGEGQQQDEGESGDNPFARETKKPRKPRSKKPAVDDGEIDAAALPPAIGNTGEEAEAKPKRTLRRRKSADDSGPAEAAE